MDDMKNIVKVAVDAYHGRPEKYTVGQSMELLREALVEANNGSTKVDYRAIRDGKCANLFSLVEQILSRTVVEGLSENDFFYNMVEFKNMAEGDQNLFLVDDDNAFVVAEIADGTQGVRRQRLGGQKELVLPTSLKAVKIYEEMNRVLSGRVDFNYMINKVAESFRQKLLEDIYSVWANASADDFGGTTYFPVAGNFNEDALHDLIDHVEAASGKTATILGTKRALRNLDITPFGDTAKEDVYNMGHPGVWYGTKVIPMPQRHKIGTNEFIFPDNELTIVAGDEKMIKCVYEGDPLVIVGNPINNGDLTNELYYVFAA